MSRRSRHTRSPRRSRLMRPCRPDCAGLQRCFALSLTSAVAQNGPGAAQSIFNRCGRRFQERAHHGSCVGFDQVAKLVPDQAPQLWQRGIALYYAGRYQDCREQFESHRTVNPDDVENAAWHFLCVARAESPAKAKAALLPVGPDSRVPMRQIYLMFRGDLTPDQMMGSARTSTESQFYGHLTPVFTQRLSVTNQPR